MLAAEFIVHGSLDSQRPFVYGFYFYTINKHKIHKGENVFIVLIKLDQHQFYTFLL